VTDRFSERRDKLRRAIAKAQAEALLVTSFVNVTYLTGFTGDDSYLLVRRDGELMISDPRYTTQIKEECPGLDAHIRRPGINMLRGVMKVVKQAKISKLAFEADSMTVALRDSIAEALPKVELISAAGLVERQRRVKDQDEIAAIRKAVWYAERAFSVLRATLRPDKTEKQIADELEAQMRLFGAKCASFPTIIAVGPRAALPHARPTGVEIGSSPFVLVDWGADGGLYKSDLTRVLITGKIPPKLERIYGVVLKAQQAAIKAIRPGLTGEAVDKVARDIIGQAGYGRYFGHGLGHGLGLEIHEAPRLAVNNQVVLKPGMVVTVEPGIYLPGFGGVRIEDDVLVTRSGHEVLTSAARDFESAVVA
jgi:Xaa-Pro aminopeptidase